MSASIGPAIARERLRARLRELRESRGLSPAEVAQRLTWHASAIEEMESGARLFSSVEVEALLALLDVDGPEVERLILLARFGRSRRWWARHGMTGEYQDHIAYEGEARRVSVYAPLFVPGLLQTPRYATAVTAAILGLSEDHPAVTARGILRAERQLMVRDRLEAGDSIELVAILDEAVLRRRSGGDEVMREQLERLAGEAQRDHVTLVILPMALGAHRGLGGVFELLEFGDDPAQSTVFLEAVACDQVIDEPRVTALYRRIADDLVRAGLGGDQASALLQTILRAYDD